MVWIKRRRIQDEHRMQAGSPSSAELDSSDSNKKRQPKSDGRVRRRRLGGKHDEDSSENSSSSSTFQIHEEQSKTMTLKGGETTSTVTEEDVSASVKSAVEAASKVRRQECKLLRFDTVQIRSYPVVLGDNPYLSIPLSIGWKYHQEEPEPVDIYDESHHINNPDYVSAHYQKPLTIEERRAVLRNQGYSDKDIREQECRRRVQIAMEWAYRFDHPDKDIPCTIPNACKVIERYIL